jgi:hypothetical protein
MRESSWQVLINWREAWPALLRLAEAIGVVALMALIPGLHANLEEFLIIAALIVGVFAVQALVHFLVAGWKIIRLGGFCSGGATAAAPHVPAPAVAQCRDCAEGPIIARQISARVLSTRRATSLLTIL